MDECHCTHFGEIPAWCSRKIFDCRSAAFEREREKLSSRREGIQETKNLVDVGEPRMDE